MHARAVDMHGAFSNSLVWSIMFRFSNLTYDGKFCFNVSIEIITN